METPLSLRVRPLQDADWAMQVASCLAASIVATLDTQAECTLALSGGTTPEPVYQALASWPLPWARIHLFQVDERMVPASDARSNARMIAAALLPALDAGAHAQWMHAFFQQADPANAYARVLPQEPFDLVVLGMGDDGHTASLFPGDGLVDSDADVLIAPARAGRESRMSLGRVVLQASRASHLIVRGAGKALALQRLLAADGSLESTPARLVHSARDVSLWADAALLEAARIIA